MPITFLADPHQGFVRATCVGLIGLADLARYVYMLVERGWLQRPQLFDARRAALAMSPQDVRVYSGLMVTLGARHGRAPIAFVCGNQVNSCVASLYQDCGAGANPRFAAFDDLPSAERWLAAAAPGPATGCGDAGEVEAGEASAAPWEGKRARRGAGRRVLVVDDTDSVRSVIARSLGRSGYEVISTGMPAEALHLLWELEGTLDLAVIDLHLAGADGDTLAGALRRLQPELPVLFISGEDAAEPIEDGPLLTKPFGADALVRCVGQYLESGCCDDCGPFVSLGPAAAAPATNAGEAAATL